MAACRGNCGALITCGCQLSPRGYCSACEIKEFTLNNPPQVQAGINMNPYCEYNLPILQIWQTKLQRLIIDSTFTEIGLNEFQVNYFLQIVTNAITMGQQITNNINNYCIYKNNLDPIRDVIIAIGQKLGY